MLRKNFKNTAENVTNYVIRIINKATGNDNTLNVTLDNVNITAKNDAALSVEGAGDTKITLRGSNTLTNDLLHAGLEHNEKSEDGSYTGKLTITSEKDADGNDTGSLTATGGNGAAGIGSSDGNGAGTIEITGGNITANGGNNAAGIGSGYNSNGNTTINIEGGTIVKAQGGSGRGSSGGAGIGSGDIGSGYTGSSTTNITISGGTIKEAVGGNTGDGIGGGGSSNNTTVTINGGRIEKAQGGKGYSIFDGGDGIHSGSLTISGGTVTANGDDGGNGIYSSNSSSVTISGGTVNAKGGSGNISGGDGICSDSGDGDYRGGDGISSSGIDLSGSLELTAKAGKGTQSNGKALSQNGRELDLDTIKDKLGPGAKVTATDANGETKQVSIPRPVEPEGPVIPEESSSSSDGSSAAPSAPASPLPGLTVTDKDGQRISYTSTQSGNTLTVCVGRLTASFRISLAALRQLRAEGIETTTFQTILCSTTLSLDELLAMGGEDAEIVLIHHIRSSTLTVGGKAV